MSSQPADSKLDFKMILNGVRGDSSKAVANELTHLFPLDFPNALNIIKSAPIILVDKLSAQQARIVGTYATRLRLLGAEVQITGQPVGKLQTLRWPILPDIAKHSGNHVICPHCGSRLQLQVVPSVAAEVSAPQPQVQQAAAPQPAPQPMPQPAPQPMPQAAPQPMPRPAPVQPPSETPVEQVVLEPIEEEPMLIDEGVALEEAPQEIAPEPEPAPAPAAPAAPIGGGGSSRVILVGKIKGDKKQAGAELMASYLGISIEEAVSLLNKRSVNTVAKDLTPDQAEDCRLRFADIGVKVTVKS